MVLNIALGALVRLGAAWMFGEEWFQNRPELGTPLSSYRNIRECVALRQSGVNPYEGDQCHELPVVVGLLGFLMNYGVLFSFYVILDLASAILVGKIGNHWTHWYDALLAKQPDPNSKSPNKSSHHTFFENLWLFNPLTIAACLSSSSQIFYNFLTLTFLHFFTSTNSKSSIKPAFSNSLAAMSLAVVSVSQIYPVQVLIPLVYYRRDKVFIISTLVFVVIFAAVNHLMNADSLSAIYSFTLTCPDYSPNTGIFWYLITEMFEHFRTFFLWILQVNIFIYALPLSIRLPKTDCRLVLWILLTIQSTFKPYSTLTDLLVPLALLPVFNKNMAYRKASFIAFTALFICISLCPVMWSQWVMLGRGNSNFFFAVSLGIVVSMSLIVTDVLLGHVKLRYVVQNDIGEEIKLELGKIQ